MAEARVKERTEVIQFSIGNAPKEVQDYVLAKAAALVEEDTE